jgi:hypothetical protein
MNIIYQELSDRIRGTLPDIDRVVERILRAWPRARESSEAQDVYLDAVALNLHSFYSGLERLFELIAGRIDRSIPSSEAWHRNLLFRMGQEIQGVRPAVVSVDHIGKLDEFRRFRHLVRNVYTINLLPDRMSKLVLTLPDLWSQSAHGVDGFCGFHKRSGRSINIKAGIGLSPKVLSSRVLE